MDRETYLDIRRQAIHARQRGVLRPFEGWALDALGELDRSTPGLLTHAFAATPIWRQSVFLCISAGVIPTPSQFLRMANGEESDRSWTSVQQDLAEAWIVMSPRQIVRATLGVIPDGLMGRLAKLGSQPMEAEDYTRLVELLTSTTPSMKLRAKTLIQLDRLDADLLAAVLALDEIALTPTVLSRVQDGREAGRLNRCIAAIRLISTGATDEAMRQSLNRQSFCNHAFVQGWISKADRLPVIHEPLDNHPELERIIDGAAAGREFSNCLRHKTGQLVSGIWGAWVWRPGRLIATVTSCLEGPLLSGVYAPGNREPPKEHVRQLKGLLRELGVLCFTRKDVPEELSILTMGEFSRFVLDEEFE